MTVEFEKAKNLKWRAIEQLDKNLEMFEKKLRDRGGKVLWALDGEEALKYAPSLFLKVLALALIESLRQLLGVKHPGTNSLEETVVTAEQRCNHATGSSSRNVHFGKQRDELDTLAIVFHDFANDLKGRKLFVFSAVSKIKQFINTVAADEHAWLGLFAIG